MLTDYSPEQCLQVVMKSPEAVASHNKTAWMSIFARYNIVEDPVGSAPHVSGLYDSVSGQAGMAPLGRFYENFIAPNQISFHVERDIVSGLQVVRDLTIEIKMSANVIVYVPMHLLYELCVQDGELKIVRLAAHWELLPMLRQQLANGWGSVDVICAAGMRMLKFFGLKGVLGFCRALRTIGEDGKRKVEQFSQLINSIDKAWLLRDFSENPMQLLFSDQRKIHPEDFLNQVSNFNLGKTLVAGNYVSASCEFMFEKIQYTGVAFFEFNLKSKNLVNIVIYLSEQGR